MHTLLLPLWTAEAYVVGTTLAFFTTLSTWFQPPVCQRSGLTKGMQRCCAVHDKG